MTTVNHFVNDCPNLNFLPYSCFIALMRLGLIISTLDIALAKIFRDGLVLMSTLEIVLANILQDVLVLLDVADATQLTLFFASDVLAFLKSLPDLLRHLLILQVETLPYRREIPR